MSGMSPPITPQKYQLKNVVKTKNGPAHYINGRWYCNCKPRRTMASRRSRKPDTKGMKFWGCVNYLEKDCCGVFLRQCDPRVNAIEASGVDNSGRRQAKIDDYITTSRRHRDTPRSRRPEPDDAGGARLSDNSDIWSEDGDDPYTRSPCPSPSSSCFCSAPAGAAPPATASASGLVGQSLNSRALPSHPLRQTPGNGSEEPVIADGDNSQDKQTELEATDADDHGLLLATRPQDTTDIPSSDESSSYDSDIWDEAFISSAMQALETTEKRRGKQKGPLLRPTRPVTPPPALVARPRGQQAEPKTPTRRSPTSPPRTIPRNALLIVRKEKEETSKQPDITSHPTRQEELAPTQETVPTPTPSRAPPLIPDSPSETSEYYSDAAETGYYDAETSDSRSDYMDLDDEDGDEEDAFHGHPASSLVSTPSRAPTVISNGLATPNVSRAKFGEGRRFKKVATTAIPMPELHRGHHRRDDKASAKEKVTVDPTAPFDDILYSETLAILQADNVAVPDVTQTKLRSKYREYAARISEHSRKERRRRKHLMQTLRQYQDVTRMLQDKRERTRLGLMALLEQQGILDG